MADRVTVVSPRDPWPFSTVTVDDLEALVADGLLRPLSGDSQPEWMAPPSGAAPSLLPGYVLSFVSFHERGFGVPTSRFMRSILHQGANEIVSPMISTTHFAILPEASRHWMISPRGKDDTTVTG
jgi:hypothetical protein